MAGKTVKNLFQKNQFQRKKSLLEWYHDSMPRKSSGVISAPTKHLGPPDKPLRLLPADGNYPSAGVIILLIFGPRREKRWFGVSSG
jgi:hypothetical protein